jgi:hypothetical protein
MKIKQETIDLREQLSTLLDKVDDEIEKDNKQRIYMTLKGLNLIKLAYQLHYWINHYKIYNATHSQLEENYENFFSIFNSIQNGNVVMF